MVFNLDLVEQVIKWDADWALRFPMRITRKQKERFLKELEQELLVRDFETERITVRTVILNRILITKCELPRFIFMAHFDTPTIMPFWLNILFRFFGHTRQIMAMIFLIGVLYGPIVLSPIISVTSPLLNIIYVLVQLVLLITLLSLFIPNPRNREDNTSGLIGLMTLAEWVKDKPDLRNHIQFVFLDNEELGLLGSNGLKRLWNKQGHPYADAFIINLDCISRGEKPLVVYHGNDSVAVRVLPFLQKHLPEPEKIDMTILPLSDNYTFKNEGAIDISYADRTILPGGYYIPKIHSPADKEFYPEKMMPLLAGLTEFMLHEMSDAKGT